ncbi:MAG: hypothetical protein JRC66_10655 [Deltaproteobacteria bacterium]|nr:hypothetical protein [Deltaproteobacteria bacterium]
MKNFNSFLSPLIQAYVDYQKASERWNEASYEPNLLLFDRYCQKQYPDATVLSQEIVDNWCRKRLCCGQFHPLFEKTWKNKYQGT